MSSSLGGGGSKDSGGWRSSNNNQGRGQGQFQGRGQGRGQGQFQGRGQGQFQGRGQGQFQGRGQGQFQGRGQGQFQGRGQGQFQGRGQGRGGWSRNNQDNQGFRKILENGDVHEIASFFMKAITEYTNNAIFAELNVSRKYVFLLHSMIEKPQDVSSVAWSAENLVQLLKERSVISEEDFDSKESIYPLYNLLCSIRGYEPSPIQANSNSVDVMKTIIDILTTYLKIYSSRDIPEKGTVDAPDFRHLQKMFREILQSSNKELLTCPIFLEGTVQFLPILQSKEKYPVLHEIWWGKNTNNISIEGWEDIINAFIENGIVTDLLMRNKHGEDATKSIKAACDAGKISSDVATRVTYFCMTRVKINNKTLFRFLNQMGSDLDNSVKLGQKLLIIGPKCGDILLEQFMNIMSTKSARLGPNIQKSRYTFFVEILEGCLNAINFCKNELKSENANVYINPLFPRDYSGEFSQWPIRLFTSLMEYIDNWKPCGSDDMSPVHLVCALTVPLMTLHLNNEHLQSLLSKIDSHKIADCIAVFFSSGSQKWKTSRRVCETMVNAYVKNISSSPKMQVIMAFVAVMEKIEIPPKEVLGFFGGNKIIQKQIANSLRHNFN